MDQPPKAPASLRVLIAEDNPLHRELARRLLARQGHEVTLVADGAAAVRAFEESPFDAILMDVQMPVMDGVEATAAIRSLERARRRSPVRIVATVADSTDPMLAPCLAAGIDDHVAKPVREDALERALDGLERIVESPTTARDLDLSEALARANGDAALLGRAADLFIGSLPKHVALIEAARQSADLERLAMAAHSLKGMVANFGADDVTAAARLVEEAAREGDLRGVDTTWPALQERLAELTHALMGLLAEIIR